MFAYCGNDPVMLCDNTGMCIHTNTESIHCKECQILINSGELYPKAIGKQNTVEVASDYEANEITKKNNTPDINTNSDNFSVAQNIVAGTLNTYGIILSAGAKTAGEAAIISGIGYVFIVPINITMDWNNPNLSTGGKWVMTGYEISTAVGGVCLSNAVVNCWNITGPVALAIAGGYTLVTMILGNILTLVVTNC